MDSEQALRESLVSVDFNEDFTEAVLQFRDNSSLCFCHRVGERWAKAIGADSQREVTSVAEELLSAIILFRLNAKHLDIQFTDGSNWDEALQPLKRSS